MEFEEYIKGREFDFYGVCNNEFKLDDDVWEAVEDPDDGYRSYMDSVQKKESDGIFFGKPLARVKIVPTDGLGGYEGSGDGFSVVDADGHKWLEFGTDTSEDYYPCFVFTYCPKES